MITLPQPGDNAPYFDKYISLVPQTKTILDELYQQHMDTVDLVTSLDDETLLSAYAPGKWTILEVLVHVMDTERIFLDRALRIGRRDPNSQPGFDQDQYVLNSHANQRKILDLVKEFSLIRSNTIAFFEGLSEEALSIKGIANNNPLKVSAIPFIICGHEIHHRNIIEERYIGK